MRSIIGNMLRNLGYDCTTAKDAHEALRKLEKDSFDIVLTDIKMPGMDGLELLRNIKTRYPDVDVVMITAFNEEYSYVDVIDAGATDFLPKPFRPDELHAKIKRILNERQLKAELLYLSIHDSLTGLYNRRYLYLRLQEEVERAKRQGRDLALIVLDVDNFKDYNDTYGHLEGDQVLATLGSILTSSIRSSVDSAYRFGGDEFAVLLIETDLSQAKKVAERIRKRFASRKIDSCTLSLGVAQLSRQGNREDLIRQADEAMYRAKRAGGNRVEEFPVDQPCKEN